MQFLPRLRYSFIRPHPNVYGQSFERRPLTAPADPMVASEISIDLLVAIVADVAGLTGRLVDLEVLIQECRAVNSRPRQPGDQVARHSQS